MAHQHDDHGHGHNEKKPVSFTVPLILAVVTLIIILLLVNLGDGGHHGKCECTDNCSKECMEACERGEGPIHTDKTEAAASEKEAAKDSTAVEATEHATEPAKEETHN